MSGPAENSKTKVFSDSIKDESLLDQILEALIQQRHLDFTTYRRKTLKRRLLNYLEKPEKIKNPAEYLKHLESTPREFDRLIDALTVQVSHFFRNTMVWEILARQLMPELIQNKMNSCNPSIRIWSAGCSTGEEAYSLAVLIHESLKKKAMDWTTHIFATDISKNALEIAETGYYPRDKFEQTKLGLLDNYFSHQDQGFLVSPLVRENVSFSYDDLTAKDRIAPADSVFGSFDIVLCRNVLIYFELGLQIRVISKLVDSLTPGGWLILGDTESPGPEFRDRLITVDHTNKIYRRR